MPNLVGIDGCKWGWLCIFEELPSRHLASKTFQTIDDVVTHIQSLDVIAIDVPIGLTDAGPRLCDREARRLLGPIRGTSVFPAPIRGAIDAPTYEEACARSLAAQDKKLSKQSWAIYPKIRQLDDLLQRRPELKPKIFEVHPEVSFHAWNESEPIVAAKKSKQGAETRLRLVANHFGERAFDTVRARYPRKDVADDDILDAFAALWTAERIHNGEAGVLPSDPPIDSAGLPMRMVF
jgi:predicted RNase H-like nuclease